MEETPKVKCINCKWMAEKRVVINPDGQVLPCCYFANMVYYSTVNNAQGIELPAGHKKQMAHNVLRSYVDSAEQHNLFSNDMESILNSKWFTETLPESWETDDPHHLCALMCGVIDDEV